MKHNLLKSLIISVILLTGVSNAWGQQDTRQFLIGDATGGNWIENKFIYPVDSYYGQDNKCCIYVWMQNGQHFAFCNYAGSQYGPKINNSEPIYDGSAIHDNDNGRGAYEKHDQDGNVITDSDGKTIPTTNAWKYTGNTGLVRICVDYSFEENVWRPYVWVEELTGVLDGSEIMFYFGNTWGWNNGRDINEQYLRTANNTNSSNIQFVGQAGFGQPYHGTYATCCKVPTGKYYISNNSTWGGIQMRDNAEAGAMYSLTNNGSDIIKKIPSVKPTWASDKTHFKVNPGTKLSGIKATCGKSVINKANTIYYCYTQDNQNYYRFNPDDVSELPLGTYTVWALACDGNIVVRSETSVTLQIANCTVTLYPVEDSYSSGYGEFTVKYNEKLYTSTPNDYVQFEVTPGSTITIVESQHKCQETFNGDLAWRASGGEYKDWQNINNPVNYPITVNNDIADNFVVRKEAVSDKKLQVFLRIPKSLEHNQEGEWNHPQPLDDDKNVDKGYPKDKFANFVYLKTTSTPGHTIQGSKPEDLGCADAGQEAGHFLMDTVHIEDNEFSTYYCTITDSCWHTIKFERKHADSDAGQGQLTCADVQRFPGGKNNCFTITGRKDDGAFIGEWGEAPTCTVTLGYCEFGRYGVVYDGKTYYSKDRSPVKIENVPIGTELQIIPGESAYPDYYTGDLVYRIKVNDKEQIYQLDASKPFTVLQDVIIDDNFCTKENMTMYLGVPQHLTDWLDPSRNGNETNLKHYLWRDNDLVNGFSMWQDLDPNDPTKVVCSEPMYSGQPIDGIYYYKLIILAGCNEIRIELKEEMINNNNKTWRSTKWLEKFELPLPITDVNCYVLEGANHADNLAEGDNERKNYTGYWTRLPQQEEGDYRLRYIEQTLTLVDGHPHTEEVYSHCSDVIKANDPEEKRTLYSLHIFNEMDEEKTYGGEIIQGLNNPAIVVEKWDGSQWVEQMRHMVFGPLRGDFSLAAMPGRRDASPIDPYDDGIENIKNDLKNIEAYSNSGTSFYIGKDNPEETDYKRYIENWGNDNCSGVWNFVVNRDDAGNINTQDPLLLEKTHRYDGEYYIRSTAAIGGWSDYTAGYNDMTRTNISKTNSNFSHYFCKWLTKNVNVRYVIANDYNLAISDDLKADKTTLMGKPIGDNDKIVADDEELPTDVNVRFSWNEKTNFLHRAYLAGSTHVQDRFLVLGGSGDGRLFDKNGASLTKGGDGSVRYGLDANEEIFQDISNWIYYTDVQMIPHAEVKLTALIKKDEQDKRIEQYFVGTSDEWNNTLLQGTCDKKYLIRVLYDFKTNQMISAYVPDRKETEDIGHIKTNLMLIREENNTETIHQLTFNTNNMEEIDQQAYGVLEFTHKTLREGSYNELSRRLYWISFPFDVRIEDAFGSLKYGTHWIIQTYNGKKRADNGLYYESESNWINNFNPNDVYNYDATEEEDKSRGILRTGAGYVVALNLKNIRRDFDLTTDSRMAIYFPSKEFIKKEIVKKGSVTIDVPAHACTKPGRDIYDSHWNVIGVPSYKSAGANFNHPILTKNDVKYYYRWLGEHDKYEPVSQSEVNFNTLFSYMVQYGGELYWENIVQEDWSTNNIAARKDVDNQKEYNLRLELQQNGNQSDRTYFTLQEDDVTALFDFNYDLCKITNAGANIYSFTSDATPIKVAGNVQPLAEDIVIPVGVVIDQAGDYTFSMPDGTAGIEVQLIDYQTNEKTNLLFGDYTINLPKGTFDNRFALLINPDKVATSVDNIGADAEGVKKYIIDGKLYLQRDSELYDAQGQLIR